MSSASDARRRSIVYVDGFNLYYGAVRSTAYKWLDLQRLFTLLRPHDDLQRIRYFSAPIDGPGRLNQETYLRALETLPLVEIVLGRFKAKRVRCAVAGCAPTGSRLFHTREEKRTDVNIAVRMLDDAYQDRCDRLIVVSGDSDPVPALNMVKLRFPKKEIIVYVPARVAIRAAAVELRSAADKHRTLPLILLPRAQLPAKIPDGAGEFILKPAGW